jgi:glutathione reductase (NADPH)
MQAVEKYGDVDVFVANFRPLKATLSGLPDRVLMKIIVCAMTTKVVGVHMCGDDAPEIIQVCMISYLFTHVVMTHCYILELDS